MSNLPRSPKTLKDFTIRMKFAIAGVLLVLTLMVSMLLVVAQSYRTSYNSHLSSAKSDFENSVAAFTKFEDSLLQLISQIQANNEIIDLLTDIESMSPGEYQAAEQVILPMLYMLSDEPDEYSCRLYVNSTLDLISDSSRILPLSMVEDTGWAQHALTGWGNQTFYPPRVLGSETPALVAPLRNQWDHLDLVGLLRVDLKPEALESRLDMPLAKDYTTYYLQTGGGATIACTDPEGEEYHLNVPEETLHGFESLRINTVQDGKNTVYYQTLSKSQWRLVMIVDESRLRHILFPQLALLALTGCGLTLVGFLFALPFLLSIVVRIRKFYRYVQTYNSQALRTVPPKFEILGTDEVGKLISAYNALLDRIQQLVDNQRQREKKLRDLEIEVLQAEINPHFLYNTPDAILWMSKLNRTDEMEKTVRNLTRFYRLCLSKGQHVLPVSQELEIIQNYFSIEETRCGQQVELILDVPQDILGLMLPKITLQPLVENALLHGVLESEKPEKWVRVTGRIRNGVPELCVIDSGGHLTPEEWETALLQPSPDQKTPKSGYGLYNVEHRLCLFFQRSQVMYLDASQPGQTCIVIPFFP